MIQGTHINALWQPRGVGWDGRWGGVFRGRWHMFTYGWFMLMYDRNQHNIVKQLSFMKQDVQSIFLSAWNWVLLKSNFSAEFMIIVSIQNDYYLSCQTPVLKIEEYQRKGRTEIKKNLVGFSGTNPFSVPHFSFVGNRLYSASRTFPEFQMAGSTTC